MALTFKISTQGGVSQAITLDQPRIVIGRGAGADIRLPARTVSDVHAVVHVDGGAVSVIDDGSTNGTRVGGLCIARGRKKALRDGDVLGIGPWSLTLEMAPGRADLPERTASIARRLLLDDLKTVGAESAPPEVVVVGNRTQPERKVQIPFSPEVLLIGRGDDCGLRLDDKDCSRHHAELVRDVDGTLIRDLGSRNGVSVGRRRVLEKKLRHGDEITIGRTTLRYIDPIDALLRSFEAGLDETAPEQANTSPVEGSVDGTRGVSDGDDRAVSLPSIAAKTAGANAESDQVSVAPKTEGGDVEKSRPSGRADWVVVFLAAVILLVSVVALVMVLRNET